MNRIRNIFGKVNTFVRGTVNYVLGYDIEDEDTRQDQSEVKEIEDDVQQNQMAGHSKCSFQVKRKKKGGKKKKKTKRNKTPSKVHPRQKKITVKIPEGPQPFNTGNLFKVSSKSHTQIDCSGTALTKQSDELLISEKTMHLDNAIKYGSKAESIDVRDEFTKQPQQRKEQVFLPLIAKQQNLATDVKELVNRADIKKPLKEGNIFKKQNKTAEMWAKIVDTNESLEEGNMLPLNGKKDDIKNSSTKECELAKTQDTNLADEHKLGRQREVLANLKLPDIHSCQGSLVSQPISCSDRNQPMATVLSKKPSDSRPSLLTIVQRGIFLNRLETIQENVDEKYFDSQSLPVAIEKSAGKIAESVHVAKDRKCLDQEKSGVSKIDFKVGASNFCLAQTTQAVPTSKNVSHNEGKKKAVKDTNSVKGAEGQDTTAHKKVLAVMKKSKKQKVKSKTNSKTNQGLNDKETVESLQCYDQGTGKLNPIVHNGKSPLERLREVESKLLAQKHSQLSKVFSRNNKVAPLRTSELGRPKKFEVKNDLRLENHQASSTSISEAVKPLLQPLKSEKSHPARKELLASSPSTRVPTVLPAPSALPRILPRCQSPKIFNKTVNEELVDHSYKCARPYCNQFTYEPSDEEEEQASSSRMTATSKSNKIELSSLNSSFAYEPSDEEEQTDTLAPAATKPRPKFGLQDRLRMGRKVMSSDKGSKESKHQTTTSETFSKPTERVGLAASTLGLPRGIETQSTDKVMLPSTSRYSTHHKQHLLPSLDPRGRNSIAKKDDLKILDLFEFED